MLNLYVLRHAHVEYGANRNPPLSPIGEKQAHAFGKWMKKNLPVATILCSDLTRAEQTAACLCKVNGYHYHTENRLREFHGWSGQFVPIDMNKDHKDWESWLLFWLRIQTLLRETVAMQHEHPVLWVTHGGVFDVLMSIVIRSGTGQSMVTLTHHTGLSHFQFQAEGDEANGELLFHNQLTHLPEKLHTF